MSHKFKQMCHPAMRNPSVAHRATHRAACHSLLSAHTAAVEIPSSLEGGSVEQERSMAWKEDGSGQLAIDGVNVRNTGGKKANAIWVEEGEGGQWTWTVGQAGAGGLWVGVAEEARFGPGYQLAGFMFGGPGNLSDGSALVTGNWGPKLQPGDTLDMRLDVTNGVSLSFRHNSRSLGTAFHISNWTGGVLRPVVSLTSKDQSITLTPSSLSAEDFTLRSDPREGGVEGKWSAENLEVTISKESPSCWRVTGKVANTIGATVTQADGGGLTVGALVTTQMMPPPHLHAKEATFAQLLAGLTDLRMEGSRLALVAGESNQLLDPAIPATAATREKIRWLN